MKVAFLGTPDLAVPSLETLSRSHSVRLVVTQPDRPSGRGRHLSPPPVKVFAGRAGLPVWQPASVRGDGPRRKLLDTGAEILVVVAYGLFLPSVLLDSFPRGAVNLHFSLLPSYRGAAPFNWAIIRGETVTGVSTFRLTGRMDAGPVYLRREVGILPGETAGELGSRLAEVGAEALEETLAGIESGTLESDPQDERLATFAPKLSKGDGEIDWSRSAPEVVNLVRGVSPWPGAFTSLGGEVLKVWRAEVAEAPSGAAGPPGRVLRASPGEGFLVAAGEGAVGLAEVQPAGKRRMGARDFLAGHEVREGAVLGRERGAGTEGGVPEGPGALRRGRPREPSC